MVYCTLFELLGQLLGGGECVHMGKSLALMFRVRILKCLYVNCPSHEWFQQDSDFVQKHVREVIW